MNILVLQTRHPRPSVAYPRHPPKCIKQHQKTSGFKLVFKKNHPRCLPDAPTRCLPDRCSVMLLRQMLQDASQMLQDDSQMLQDDSQMLQDASKDAPKCLPAAPRCLPDAPRLDASQMLQDAPTCL